MNSNERYAELRKRLDKEIEIMKQSLEAMDIAQKKNTSDYGWIGNCCHILDRIEDINAFLHKY